MKRVVNPKGDIVYVDSLSTTSDMSADSKARVRGQFEIPGEPSINEIAVTSAPLISASYFIGARCNEYNEDFMLCKAESGGKSPNDCLKEGRRVTRCAISVLRDINKHCAEQFKLHWNCLERGNQQLYQCRPLEWQLNKCVYDNLKLEKAIPGAPKDETPVHLRKRRFYRPFREDLPSDH